MTLEEVIVSELDKIRQKEKKVRNKEYWQWLFDFLETQKNQYIDDDPDNFYFLESKEDMQNISLLHYLFGYILTFAKKQNVTPNKIEGYGQEIWFKYKNNFYEMKSIFGQGSLTSIKRIEEIPEKFIFIK